MNGTGKHRTIPATGNLDRPPTEQVAGGNEETVLMPGLAQRNAHLSSINAGRKGSIDHLTQGTTKEVSDAQ